MTEPSVPAVPIMSKAKARRLIDRIKTDAERLWALLLEAHDGGAWKALGYKSWAECAEVEFGKSRSRSYQLLDHARLMGELKAAPNVSTRVDTWTPKDSTRLGAEGRVKLAEDHAAATTTEEADEVIERATTPPVRQHKQTPTPTPEEVPVGGLVVRDLRLPTALNHRAEERADDAGITVNEYVVALIEADLDLSPTTNGQAKQQARVRAPALEAAMARAGSTPPATSPRALHTHKAEGRGASGLVRCKCGASKGPTGWVEP